MKKFAAVLFFLITFLLADLTVSAGPVEVAQYRFGSKIVTLYGDHHNTDQLFKESEESLARNLYIESIIKPYLKKKPSQEILLLLEDSDYLEENQFLFHLSEHAKTHQNDFHFIEYNSIDLRNHFFTQRHLPVVQFVQQPMLFFTRLIESTGNKDLGNILKKLQKNTQKNCATFLSSLKSQLLSRAEFDEIPVSNLDKLALFITPQNSSFDALFYSIIEAYTLWYITETKKTNIVAVLGYEHVRTIVQLLKKLGATYIRSENFNHTTPSTVQFVSPLTFDWILDV